uniref:hypothetical protein n=1 Tax=Ningiella ruwaisensis TaxID=2364274 RepID=UPI00109F78F0|nr:hypothetical protein [Ningiella ruwaisensis]
MLKTWLMRIFVLIVASAVGFVFASIFHTQAVLAKLSEIDIQIPFNERLTTTGQDLIGLAPTYGPLVLVALLIAFSIAGALNKKLHLKRAYLYPVAGAVAFLVMLLAMQPILNVTLLAGARGLSGMVLQMIAGLIAGLIFAQLHQQQK